MCNFHVTEVCDINLVDGYYRVALRTVNNNRVPRNMVEKIGIQLAKTKDNYFINNAAGDKREYKMFDSYAPKNSTILTVLLEKAMRVDDQTNEVRIVASRRR